LGQEPKYGETFIVAWDNDPKHFMPHTQSSRQINTIVANIYGSLVYYDPESGDPYGYLASTWSFSDEGKVITFNLNKASWDDGVPFTSADVVFTWEALEEYHPSYAAIWGDNLESVTAPDESTVVFTFNEPSAIAISSYNVMILPKHIFEGLDLRDNPHNLEPPVSLGPYKFQEYIPGSHVTLVRNDQFFIKDKPYFDRLIFRFITEPTLRAIAVESGEASYANQIPAEDFKRFDGDPDLVAFVQNPGATAPIERLEFNNRNEYFQHKTVRKAVAHAIDMAKVVRLAYGGIEAFRVSESHVHYAHGWAHATDLPPYEFDPAKAELMLDQAGFPRGTDGVRFTVELLHRPYDDERNMAAVIKENLKDVGIEVEVTQLERATFAQRMADWDYDFLTLRYGTGNDPNGALFRMYHTDQIQPAGWMNTMGYSNPEVDALLEEQVRETDRNTRAEILYRIQEILWDDLPGLPISDRAYLDGYRAEFAGDINFCQDGRAIMYAWSIYGASRRELELTESMDSITAEVGEITSDLEDLSTRLEASSEDLAGSIGDLSTSIDSLVTEVGESMGNMASDIDTIKDDVTSDVAALKSSVGTLQTILLVTLLVAIISVVIPFVKK
jgi:peptide/nickel transport system substrate-binding protein